MDLREVKRYVQGFIDRFRDPRMVYIDKLFEREAQMKEDNIRQARENIIKNWQPLTEVGANYGKYELQEIPEIYETGDYLRELEHVPSIIKFVFENGGDIKKTDYMTIAKELRIDPKKIILMLNGFMVPVKDEQQISFIAKQLGIKDKKVELLQYVLKINHTPNPPIDFFEEMGMEEWNY